MGFEAHTGVSAGIQEERTVLRRGVHMVVVLELSEGEEVIPVILLFIGKDT